jgi:hypothetical protein
MAQAAILAGWLFSSSDLFTVFTTFAKDQHAWRSH